ncbi:Kanadaptin [Halotydeus destructor]|nr:Kanadaptin [Halotydeus destructor]
MSVKDDEDLSVTLSFKVPELPLVNADHNINGNELNEKSSEPVERPVASLPEPLTPENPPSGVYFLEVMKNGNIVERINMEKNRVVFGRAKECDVQLEHPSLSRYHAAILWKNFPNSADGFFYLVDLNSVHGTMLNKSKATASTLLKIDVDNNVIRLGGSSRSFMLGSTFVKDTEEEDEGEKSDPNACGWGIDVDDAKEVDADGGETLSLLNKIQTLLNTPQTGPSVNENAYKENTQKTLQQWFEREGYELEYKVEFINTKFKCVVELPVEGQDIEVAGEPQPRKKDAIANACFKACQLLDKAEELFPWQQQKQAKKRRRHDSDEDAEDVEDETDEAKAKKARKELLKAKVKASTVATFETLREKWDTISKELQSVKAQLANMSTKVKPTISQPAEDDLDNFMMTLSATSKDSLQTKIEKSKLHTKIKNLEKDQLQVERLLKLSQPNFTLPALSVVPVKEEPVIVSTPVEEKPTTEKVLPPPAEAFAAPMPPKALIVLKKPLMKPNAAFREEIPEKVKPKLGPQPKPQRPQSTSMGVASILKTEKVRQKTEKELEAEEDYVGWVPPKNQSGDGKISLNEKLGY